MEFTQINQIEVSIFSSMGEPGKPTNKPLASIINAMQSDKWQDKIENVRACKRALQQSPKDAELKARHEASKKKLPCFTASGTFSRRAAKNLIAHSGLIQLDLDGKDNPDWSVEDMREIVEADPHTRFAAISPSGDGIKALIRIPANPDTHLASYKALKKLYASHGLAIDQSCKDLSRAFFVTYDPQLFQRDFGDTLELQPLRETKPAKREYKITREYSSELSPDDEAAKCLDCLDPDMDYGEWLNTGMATHSHGASCATWDAWSSRGSKYKQGEPERKWSGFNGDGVKFGSLVHMATEANGGINPVSRAKNSRPPVRVNTDTDFDVIEEGRSLDTVEEMFYHKRLFYGVDAKQVEYIGFGVEHLNINLRMKGYSAKGADGEVSAVDKLKKEIISERHVHHVGVIAGRSIGMVENQNGIRHLVTRQNRRVEPVAGDWPIIKQIVESVFGNDQLPYFYAWLHRSRQQLIREDYLQGHALVIAGSVGKGKSLIQETIVSKLLGASAKASLYLTGGTTFNADLVGSELLTIDDDGGDRDAKSRRVYGDRLKMITAGSKSVQCHGKGVDGYMVEPLWRVCICMNDDDQAMGAFPPIGEGDCDSVGDKILMLKCLGLSPLPFTRDADQSTKLESSIKCDLPGFAHFIDNYEIPKEIKTGDCRFGFNEWHHPELLEIVNQDSNERTLLSATDEIFFDQRDDFSNAIKLDPSTQRYYWEGTALEWAKLLCEARHLPTHKTISGMLSYGDAATKAGKVISAMAKISNGRVIQRRVESNRLWKIWQRIEEPHFDDDPF